MKKLISLISAASLALGMRTAVFAADIQVTVEGTPVAWTDAKPFIDENSRTLVPLRPIANALGLTVAWNDDTNTAAFTDGEGTLEFTVGSNKTHSFLNDLDFHVYLEIDTTPVIKDSRIYAPARYLAECFQYTVGWDEPTKTVSIVKAEAEEKDGENLFLPEVPAGEVAAAFPMTTAAGTAVSSYIAFDGVTFVEEPDIFEYDIKWDCDAELNSYGTEALFEEGYLLPELEPALTTEPGTYPVTWTLPAEWFVDAKEDIVVSTTLTVTAPTAESALAYAMSNMSSTLFAEKGSTLEDITEDFISDLSWLLEGTTFSMEVTDDSYDETNGVWSGTLVLSDGTDSAEAEISIPVEDPDEFFDF